MFGPFGGYSSFFHQMVGLMLEYTDYLVAIHLVSIVFTTISINFYQVVPCFRHEKFWQDPRDVKVWQGIVSRRVLELFNIFKEIVIEWLCIFRFSFVFI